MHIREQAHSEDSESLRRALEGVLSGREQGLLCSSGKGTGLNLCRHWADSVHNHR